MGLRNRQLSLQDEQRRFDLKMVKESQEWDFLDLSWSEATPTLVEFTLLLCILLWI